MAWVAPKYSKGQVDRAGDLIASRNFDDFDALFESLDILNNWRSAHSFPLNTFQMWLRRRAYGLSSHALVAQRIKRVPSIISKLQRFEGMKLSRMQDIGGCRAIVPSTANVRKLRKAYDSSDLKHQLVNEKDYISAPKSSGYRGIHLVYRYRSDKTPTYNGLQIEIQLRSRIQHAWATAVETVGTFLQQSLKSSEGPEPWLEFFALTSSAFAQVEKAPAVPGHPAGRTLTRELRRRAKQLGVVEKLGAYGKALEIAQDLGKGEAHYFLLSLDTADARLEVRGFPRSALEDATREYLEVEKAQADRPGAQAVLVSADSINALQRSYPNYFLDTQLFMEALDLVMS